MMEINLITPMRMMQRRHLVLVASLRERDMGEGRLDLIGLGPNPDRGLPETVLASLPLGVLPLEVERPVAAPGSDSVVVAHVHPRPPSAPSSRT